MGSRENNGRRGKSGSPGNGRNGPNGSVGPIQFNGPSGGIGGVGGTGSAGPDSNCAGNGPDGCSTDTDKSKSPKKNSLSIKRKTTKAKSPRTPKKLVGNQLWSVQSWLKHG